MIRSNGYFKLGVFYIILHIIGYQPVINALLDKRLFFYLQVTFFLLGFRILQMSTRLNADVRSSISLTAFLVSFCHQSCQGQRLDGH